MAFLRYPKSQFTVPQLSDETGIPIATAYRLMEHFSQIGWVKVLEYRHINQYGQASKVWVRMVRVIQAAYPPDRSL